MRQRVGRALGGGCAREPCARRHEQPRGFGGRVRRTGAVAHAVPVAIAVAGSACAGHEPVAVTGGPRRFAGGTAPLALLIPGR